MEQQPAVLRRVAVALPGGVLGAAEAAELPLGGGQPGGAEAFRRLVERSRIASRRVALSPAELLALGGATERARS